ncbi:hypothetical protein [Ruegeria arenilitoris]|uniref:Uncharacterized protein n=1 Tax=Ruegeria arenilitoris TaxID=1173585 RepID=A0A238KHU1_9RHOB|nr:hypothetical protein [Ruegeria arenilitoris]SMX42429.1 hypothetical protein RUA8715_02242 [Ruegeria arenilitoris]
MSDITNAAETLAGLYTREFGGKASGRYRIPQKLLRELCGRRRLYQEDITALTRELLEMGYVMIDMDSFFVVMSANSFVNYRRVGKEMLAHTEGTS